MIINYRLYIITIIAIFLALGVGIIIGFLMDSQQIFADQQAVIISDIESRIEEAKLEKYNLQTIINQYSKEKSTYEDFTRIAYNNLVKNRLDGLKVAIIQTTDEFIFSNVTKPLTDAGAEISSITYIKKDFVNFKPDQSSSIFQQLDALVGFEDEDIIAKLSFNLAMEVLKGETSELLELLRTYKMIERVENHQGLVDYVIIVGGSSGNSSEKVKKIDIPIINAVKDSSIPIIGVEKGTITNSYINFYKEEQISTIDNVDSMIGQISMIMVMTGNQGNYGFKPEAETIMPEGFME